ncbi:MAG: uncharacterized membrane protein YgdD (TMEM256/DUF423 family) [Polaribacter sp.]|jgi:uncharacterized membrane protein YgdD (TMEM256/DUF423 family)
MHKWIMITGVGFSILSVILGAFAAHALKERLTEYSLNVFQTGVQYQSIHGIALLLCGLFATHLKNQSEQTFTWLTLTASLFILGIVCFSGSLYGLALTSQKWFGPITPIGGVFFILGWICFLVAIVKS